MPTVANCLRQHGETFLQQYSDKISLQQRKVLSAIQRCRTGEPGSVIFENSGCGEDWLETGGTAENCRRQTALLLQPKAYSLKPPVRLAVLARVGKGGRTQFAERPAGCCAQLSPDSVSRRCQHCGGTLHFVAITDSSGRVLVSRPLPLPLPLPPLVNLVTNFLDS